MKSSLKMLICDDMMIASLLKGTDMAHELDFSTGQAAIAYVGEVPWHKLGTQLKSGAPIETWVKEARLDWNLVNQPVMYLHEGKIQRMEDWFVLARSDNGEALSVVSKEYFPVQPKEVLEFYRDLTKDYGYVLETAGALNGGRKIWALAKTGFQDTIKDGDDEMAGYLLLATSCDKSIATTIAFTSVRVVCQNTLNISLKHIGKSRMRSMKIPHNKLFKPGDIKRQLGLLDQPWKEFIGKIRKLADAKVDEANAEKFFEKLLRPDGNKKSGTKPLSPSAAKEHQRLMSAYRTGVGQDTASAKGTAWGLVNAVTYYVDHVRPGNGAGARLNNAWFGVGANLKDKAWDQAIEMVSGK